MKISVVWIFSYFCDDNVTVACFCIYTVKLEH